MSTCLLYLVVVVRDFEHVRTDHDGDRSTSLSGSPIRRCDARSAGRGTSGPTARSSDGSGRCPSAPGPCPSPSPSRVSTGSTAAPGPGPRADIRPDQIRAGNPQVFVTRTGEGVGRVATDLLDPQSSEDLAPLLQRRDELRGDSARRARGPWPKRPRPSETQGQCGSTGEYSDSLLGLPRPG